MAKKAWINRNDRKRATAKKYAPLRFKMSRLTFRELASQGLIPGVTKSSW